MRGNKLKSFAVSSRTFGILAHVVAKCLLVKIAEKMERFDANVGSAKPALQETPKVFEIVGVNFSVHVGNGVVYHLVRVVSNKSFVGWQGVGEESRASCDVLAHFGLQRFLFAARDYVSADLATAFEESNHRSLALVAHVHLSSR